MKYHTQVSIPDHSFSFLLLNPQNDLNNIYACLTELESFFQTQSLVVESFSTSPKGHPFLHEGHSKSIESIMHLVIIVHMETSFLLLGLYVFGMTLK